MRLTSYTDYALRALMYLALNRERLVTIQDIADTHGIAKNHLTKVVHQLGLLGIVETVRGRSGGLRLAREPEEINIGAVVRETESDFHIAECFNSERDTCIYSPSCVMRGTLGQATMAFLSVLDGVTLADMVKPAPGQPGSRAKANEALRTVPLQFKPKAAARAK
ncbi:MAG: RrF2 family transcriptional regulator [Noviherbaspirillum sp.]